MLNHPELMWNLEHDRIDHLVRAASLRGYDGDGRLVGHSARRRRGRLGRGRDVLR